MTYEEFSAIAPISPETFERLRRYHDLLVKWQKSMNLIAPSTVGQIWRRHMLDSAQLLSHVSPFSTILDIGSGAGFPGLVLAIGGAGQVTLVESDRKKCQFLREAARITNTKVTILNQRVEDMQDQTFDMVVSRATAPLIALLEWSMPLMHDQSFCLFPKGEKWATELEQAKKQYVFAAEILPDKASATGCIIKIGKLFRK